MENVNKLQGDQTHVRHDDRYVLQQNYVIGENEPFTRLPICLGTTEKIVVMPNKLKPFKVSSEFTQS